jgi:hypothetical protein
MINIADLVNGMATTFQNIPELVAVLAPVNPVIAYIDFNPTRNSLSKALYQMQPGQVLVAWTETIYQVDEMTAWSHLVQVAIRPLREHSDFEVIDQIMNGVPQPGDGLVWRRCPLIDGVLPTNVTNIRRETDTEGVDYTVLNTETLETGDYPN